MANMFSGCTSLISLDLTGFNTENVEDMNSMFSGCTSLNSINLLNFDTSKVINMAGMFENCQSLNSIDLSKFNTEKVENMNSMFSQCNSLKIINLSNFDTSLVQTMDSMFYNCNALNILDISNFNMESVTSNNQMLSGLNNLNFINLYNIEDNGYISGSALNSDNSRENVFYVCQRTNIITNIKSLNCCNYYDNEAHCDNEKEISTILYKSMSTIINPIITNGITNPDFINITKEIEEVYKNIKENLKDQTFQIIETEHSIFQYSTVYEQLNNSSKIASSIDLGECETLLRNQEGLNETEQFLMIKLDIKNSSMNGTFVQYEIFHPRDYKKVSLDVCKNVSIKIQIPVTLHESHMSLISSLEDEGYNIFNLNDSFYNDICSTYTAQNGADMTLSSRKTIIYDSIKDIYLCQDGCEFESFDTSTSKAQCACKIQEKETVTDVSKISFDKSEFFDSFYSTLYNSNFRVLKCMKLIFSLPGMKENYGSYIMSALLGIFFTFIIVHIIKGQKRVIHIINHILKSKGILGGKNNIQETKNENVNEESHGTRKIGRRKSHKKHSHQSRSYTSKKNLMETKDKKIEELQAPLKKRSSKKNITEKNKRNVKINEIFVNTNDEMNKKTIEPQEESKKEDDGYHSHHQHRHHQKNKEIFGNYHDLTDEEMNSLDYDIAILVDKRTFCQYYFALLKKDQLIIFTFYTQDDYNLRQIKILLFIVSFSLFFTINAFFFSDSTMDKIYEDNGIFNFVFQLPQILYSSIISSVINIILQKLSISEGEIIDLKKEKDPEKVKKKAKNIKKCLTIKLVIFIILSSILMLFFWYFISCFCAAYKNTQLILIEDTLISFLTSMIYPFGFKLLPSAFRIPALRAHKKDKKCMYTLSRILNII